MRSWSRISISNYILRLIANSTVAPFANKAGADITHRPRSWFLEQEVHPRCALPIHTESEAERCSTPLQPLNRQLSQWQRAVASLNRCQWIQQRAAANPESPLAS